MDESKTDRGDDKRNEFGANLKLYAKEQADHARNQAIGVFSFIAVVLAILTGLGVYGGAKAYIDEKIKEGQLTTLVDTAKQQVDEAKKSASDAAAARELTQQLEAEVTRILQALKNRLQTLDYWIVGTADDGETVYAPPDTSTDQWHIVLVPNEIGFNEKGSNWDNSIFYYYCQAQAKGDRTGWTIVAKHRTRLKTLSRPPPGGDNSEYLKPRPNRVTYVLFRKKHG